MSEPLVDDVQGSSQSDAELTEQPEKQALTSIPKTAAGAAISKMISASVGDIVALMARAPSRKHFALSDIEWLVLPPVIARQFYVAEAQSKETGFRAPVAAVTWAEVSDDVDKRLTEAVTGGSRPSDPAAPAAAANGAQKKCGCGPTSGPAARSTGSST